MGLESRALRSRRDGTGKTIEQLVSLGTGSGDTRPSAHRRRTTSNVLLRGSGGRGSVAPRHYTGASDLSGTEPAGAQPAGGEDGNGQQQGQYRGRSDGDQQPV